MISVSTAVGGNAQGLHEAAAIALGRRFGGEVEFRLPIAFKGALAGGDRHRKSLDDIGGPGNKVRALLDEVVATFCARIERGAGDGEDLAVLLESHARRDERAGALGRLDDDDTEREPGHQAVAAWKVPGAGLPAHGHLGDQGATLVQDGFGQRDVLGRIEFVEPAGQHGHGSGAKTGGMRRGVDAARQAGDDRIALGAEVAGQHPSEFLTGGGGVARADDADGELPGEVFATDHGEQGRGMRDVAQQRRIGGFARSDEACPAFLYGGEFVFDFVDRGDARGRQRAAAADEAMELLKRGFGRAVAIEKLAESVRPDVFGADQPQPGGALRTGEVLAFRPRRHVTAPSFRCRSWARCP